MKKIILLCSAGMSTGMLVKKMQAAAAEDKYECEIAAYPMADAKNKASDADVILLGPQVRFAKSKIEGQCPGIPLAVIDMRMYGRMDGKGVMNTVYEMLK